MLSDKEQPQAFMPRFSKFTIGLLRVVLKNYFFKIV